MFFVSLFAFWYDLFRAMVWMIVMVVVVFNWCSVFWFNTDRSCKNTTNRFSFDLHGLLVVVCAWFWTHNSISEIIRKTNTHSKLNLYYWFENLDLWQRYNWLIKREREREREKPRKIDTDMDSFKSYLYLYVVLVIHGFSGVCFGKSKNCGSTFIQNIVSCHKLSSKTLSFTLYFQTDKTFKKNSQHSVYTFAFCFSSWHKAIVGLFLGSFIFILPLLPFFFSMSYSYA